MNQKLATFGLRVLEILEDDKEWSSDTSDAIFDAASDLGLCRTGEDGMFAKIASQCRPEIPRVVVQVASGAVAEIASDYTVDVTVADWDVIRASPLPALPTPQRVKPSDVEETITHAENLIKEIIERHA